MKRALALFLFTALAATGAFAQLTAPETDPNATGGSDGGGSNFLFQPQLKDHGGQRLAYAKVVYIFWGPLPAGYASELVAFRNEYGGMAEHMGMLAQYGAPQSALTGSQADVFDPVVPPRATDDSSVQAEVGKHFAGRYDTNAVYVVVIASGHYAVYRNGDTSCYGGQFRLCAYHQSYRDSASGIDVKYAVIPYADCEECRVHAPDGIYASDAQNAEVNIVHEVREAMIDPIYLTAWYDDNHAEGDDKCAFGVQPDNVFYRHTIPGANDAPSYHPSRFFFFQKEWSNASHGCVE
ncbi:MAG TPA: hypothetical protein VGR02_22220 [Thermoanaerobaculia bacterium]|jgi:hypothetical protein|nr:hypothetical protein [Thermoanaerobaculia bacterium]